MIASSRNTVLQRIRDGLGPTRTAEDVAVLDARFAQPPRWTRPVQAGDVVQRFKDTARKNLTLVETVAGLAHLPDAVQRIATNLGIQPHNLSVAPSLASVAWPSDWSIHFGAGRLGDALAVSDALAGVAETGSLVLHSAAERPTGLNFLPDIHFAVLRRSSVVAHFEDVWPMLRHVTPWPRTINIISAASRTADVAQIVVRPAHGPKQLVILLLEDT